MSGEKQTARLVGGADDFSDLEGIFGIAGRGQSFELIVGHGGGGRAMQERAPERELRAIALLDGLGKRRVCLPRLI